jgi:putative transposase
MSVQSKPGHVKHIHCFNWGAAVSTFTLTVGLVIREGQRTWRLDRTIADGRLVFVELETGAPKTISPAELQRDLEARRLILVQEYPVALAAKAEGEALVVQTVQDLSEKEQLSIRKRLAYVKHMLHAGIRRGMRSVIDAALKRLNGRLPAGATEESAEVAHKVPSSSTVMSWMRDFDKSGGNPLSLINQNSFRTSPRRINSLIEEVARRKIRDFYCSRKRPTITATKLQIDKELEQHAARGRVEQNDAKISKSTLRRLILEVSPYDRDVARYGSERSRNNWRYSLGGVQANRVLARYEIDHTILDIVVVDDRNGLPLGRPTITVVVDRHSGYIAGMHVSFWSAGLASTLAALKVAIRPKDFLTEHAGLTNKWIAHGIPDLFVVDNGLEFHSPQFHAIAMHLSTDVLHCAVRQPWLKAMVERVIGEINRYLPTEGRVEPRLTNYLPLKPEKTACVTFSSLCMGLLKAVVDVHPFEVNDRRLTRAYDLYSEGLATQLAPRLAASLEELDIIVASTDTHSVSNEGVFKNYIRYNSTELQDMRRRVGLKFRTQVKFNPEDISHVWVRHPEQANWLRVPSCFPEYTAGLSEVQHKAIRALKKEELARRNAEEVLTKAKLELADMWSSAIRSGKRLKGAQLKAFAGLTSGAVLSAPAMSHSGPAVSTPVPLTKEDLLPAAKTFETYEFI